MTTTLPPTACPEPAEGMTPTVARLLWREALDEWGEHWTSGCAPCKSGQCREIARLAEVERTTKLVWLEARRMAGEVVP